MIPFPKLTPADSPKTIFDEIEKYAASQPKETWTRSKSTVDIRLQLGKLSGIAIYKLGAKVLDGADHFIMRHRLRCVHRMLRKDPAQWTEGLMRALMEMQRIDHPDHCRRKAWNLIFYAMEKGGCAHIADALKSWNRGSDNVEMDIFLWQLAACKLSGWTLQPRDFNLRPNVHATRQSKCGAPRPERLSASFYQLLLACLDPARPTSHRSFSLEWMLALITTHPPGAASPDIQTSLATFFREFIARDSFKELCENAVDIDEVDKLQRVLERDPAAHCFIHDLAAAPDGVRTTNLSTVISHILHVLHIVRPTIPLGDEQAPLLKLYPDLRDSPVQSHTLPFLCFLVLLTWKSKVAVGVCVEVGLLETLDRIILRYPNDAMMNNVYGATLATMSRHAPVVQRIRMFAMWRSSYSSEQEFASMAEAFAATGVSDPAPDSRARTLSFETTSTTTLPSAHGHRLMGAVVSDQALMSSPKPIRRELDDGGSRETPLADISRKCIARAESFAARGDVEDAVSMYAVANTVIALLMRRKIQQGWKRQEAEPLELSYDMCKQRIQTLCQTHGVSLPHIDPLPPHPSPASTASSTSTTSQTPVTLPVAAGAESVRMPIPFPAMPIPLPGVTGPRRRYGTPVRQQSIQEVLEESANLMPSDDHENASLLRR